MSYCVFYEKLEGSQKALSLRKWLEALRDAQCLKYLPQEQEDPSSDP